MQEKGHSKHVVMIALLVLLVLVCSVSADARQTISRVQITSSAENVQIIVTAGSAVSVTAAHLSKYLVFDVQGHLNNDQIRQVKVNSGDIGIVKCGWYKQSPPVARIAMSVSSKRPYTIKYSSDKRQATITVAKRGAEAELSAKPTAPAAKPVPKPARAVAPKIEKPAAPVIAVEAERETCSTGTPIVDEPADEPVAVEQKPTPEPVKVEQKPAPEPVEVVHKPVLIASTRPIAIHSTAIESAPSVTAGNRVSLDFVGTDIQDVLKALALQSNSNIVASPEVKGEVTVALNNVTVDEALRLVTNLSGFKFQDVGGTYVVGTAGNLDSLANGAAPPEAGLNRVADVAMIRHADPTMLSKMLAAQFKGIDVSNAPVGDAKNNVPNGTSILVLSGTAQQVESAKALVAQVENSLAANAAATEMDLYEVKYADINELAAVLAAYVPGLRVTLGPNQGFNLQSPQALAMGNGSSGSDSGSGSGSSGGSSDSKNIAPPKVLMLQGSAAEIAKAKEFLAKIDVQQPQIVIEAKVLDIRNDDSKNLGIEWSWNDVEFSELEKSPLKEPTAITLGKFNRWPETIIAKVNALVTAGKARVLANPSVSALDGKPASIFIGDEFKYVINIQQTPTGVNVTTETARVGVQLHAICRVSSDGFITMDLHPEVSVITDFIELPSVGLSLPEISRRYIDSTIRIKDGETIVIGGLILDTDIERMSGVPILKDLPLIGGLFRSRETQKEHSEIMMFITPRILTNSP